jgi:hypothetical protein
VRLPGRALGGKKRPRAAWILAANSQPSSTPWHIVIDRTARRVVVYRDGRPRAIIARSSADAPGVHESSSR